MMQTLPARFGRTNPDTLKRGLFVSQRGCLEGVPRGGVQICTEEYVSVIQAAGIRLEYSLLDLDRRLSTRLMRRAGLSGYKRPVEAGALRRIASDLQNYEPEFVFLNHVTLATLATHIRQELGATSKIVVLSHGLESTDLLHAIRLREYLPVGGYQGAMPARALGQAILSETMLRSNVDVVCALSPFDVELEHWLGTRRVDWLPRIVTSAPLDWRPGGGRLGFVGSLDHAPNLEGLVEVLGRLAPTGQGCVVRVVGGSAATGRWLAQSFSGVEYLGPLSDEELRDEAATWNAFMHPIFCYPRGCSTKLATAMSWHLPIITTSMGHRGYDLGCGRLVVADDPSAFAAQCVRLLDVAAARDARSGVIEAARSSPSLQDNAQRLRALLGLSGPPHCHSAGHDANDRP